GVPGRLQARVGLLADDRADDDVSRRLHDSSPASASVSESSSSASSEALAGVAPESPAAGGRFAPATPLRSVAEPPASGASGSLPSRTSRAAAVNRTRSAARSS